MQNSKILTFFKKHNLYIFGNSIWQRDSQLKTWTIVWPQNSSRVRIWDSYSEKKN